MQGKIKIVIDIAITILLLALMSYELIGAATHEWLGISIFLLFILHHVLNRKWLGSMGKGKYTPARILQTALVVLALISMLGSMFSGIILSRHALAFLPIHSGVSVSICATSGIAQSIADISAWHKFRLSILSLFFKTLPFEMVIPRPPAGWQGGVFWEQKTDRGPGTNPRKRVPGVSDPHVPCDAAAKRRKTGSIS